MNAQRILRQLRREIKANPKRAALLGGLVAVGIYFWAPLVAGWVLPKESAKGIAKSSAAKSPPKSATPNQSGQVSPGQANPGQADPGQFKPIDSAVWTQLWAAIQDDNRTKPSATLAIATNPFRPFPEPEEPESENSENGGEDDASAKTAAGGNSRPAPVVEITPKTLGMKLTGTVIGSRRRAAVIDGKIVPEGALVSGGDSETKSKDASAAVAAKATFRLVRVEHESIVLERDAKEYTLVLEKSEDDGIELIPLNGT